MDTSPEEKRIAELATRVRDGSATDAEREELALYGEDHPDAQALVVRADREEELGGHWLVRSKADARLAAAEKTPLVRAERGVGMALAAGGFVGAFFVPAAAVVMAAGLGVLAFSVLRVKIQTAGEDPYSDIEK